MVMMPYNPPYYEQLLTGWGLEKVKDLLAYKGTVAKFDNKRLELLERRIRRAEPRVAVRGLRMKEFGDHMAKQLKPIVDPDLALIGEHDGEPVGFALALPDVNQAIRHVNGRLFPFGIFKLLWHMRRINGIRIITLGLKPEHRKSGLASLLYFEVFKRARAQGHTWGESSWVLEDNHPMLSGLEKMRFWLYKTYRVYEKAVSD